MKLKGEKKISPTRDWCQIGNSQSFVYVKHLKVAVTLQLILWINDSDQMWKLRSQKKNSNRQIVISFSLVLNNFRFRSSFCSFSWLLLSYLHQFLSTTSSFIIILLFRLLISNERWENIYFLDLLRSRPTLSCKRLTINHYKWSLISSVKFVSRYRQNIQSSVISKALRFIK